MPAIPFSPSAHKPIAHHHMLVTSEQPPTVRKGALRSLPVSEPMRPVVLSVRSFTGLEPIDGGDTIVVRFQAPDGREIALLVPKPALTDLRLLLDGSQ